MSTASETDDLVELTRNLAGEHLTISMGLLLESREGRQPQSSGSWINASQYALSSILHAYCGLEAAINLIGHNLFFNPRSSTYVPPDPRDLPSRRMVQAWPGTPAIEKLSYILFLAKTYVPSRLENEVRELNNYRNWIAHGFTYNTTLLLDKVDDDTSRIVDREDDVNWEVKYPNTKFHALDMIDDSDATTALRIVLTCLKIMAPRGATVFGIGRKLKRTDLTITFNFITAEFDVIDYLK